MARFCRLRNSRSFLRNNRNDRRFHTLGYYAPLDGSSGRSIDTLLSVIDGTSSRPQIPITLRTSNNCADSNWRGGIMPITPQKGALELAG